MNPKFILFSLLHSPCLPTLFTSLLSFSFQESKPTVCRLLHSAIFLSFALRSAPLSISSSSVPRSLRPSVLLWCPGPEGGFS